jgi:hypothetical protein
MTEVKDYNGIRVYLIGYMYRTKTTFSIVLV